MIATLDYLETELRIYISTICQHLRNKAYIAGSEPHQNALKNLFYFALLADELGLLLGHHKNAVESIERYLIGDAFHPYSEDEHTTIHQYCLTFFEKVECPLGSATDELKSWIVMRAERQQSLREGFEEFFPNLDFLTTERDEAGEEQLVPVTNAELFNSKTQGFLRDIEASNVLEEFNQRMNKAYELLKEEAPIVNILSILKGEQDPE